MKRRDFMKTAGVAGTGAAAVAATSSFPKPAIAQQTYEWRMVTSWPKGLPGVFTGAERFARRLGEATDGRIKVQVFGAGEVVPGLEVWDAVSNGTVEMGHDASYYHMGKTKAAGFFTAVPFGMTQMELNAWITMGGGQELWNELYADYNLVPFPCGNTGVQMGGWFRKEINTVEDLNGLKFRVPGIGGEMMKKVGATVVLLPGGEVFAALQSGAIDGTEWIGPYNDLAMGFYKVANHYYWPGTHEPGSMLQLTVNKEKFDALPKDLQDTIRACSHEEHLMMSSEYYMRSSTALETLVREHGVNLRQFPKEVLTALGAAAGEVVTELRDSGDPMTEKVATAFLAARKELLRWTLISDQGYTNARRLDFPYPG